MRKWAKQISGEVAFQTEALKGELSRGFQEQGRGKADVTAWILDFSSYFKENIPFEF